MLRWGLHRFLCSGFFFFSVTKKVDDVKKWWSLAPALRFLDNHPDFKYVTTVRCPPGGEIARYVASRERFVPEPRIRHYGLGVLVEGKQYTRRAFYKRFGDKNAGQ